MASQTQEEAERSLDELETCPLCGGREIEVRWDDGASLAGYCRTCGEYFEI